MLSKYNEMRLGPSTFSFLVQSSTHIPPSSWLASPTALSMSSWDYAGNGEPPIPSLLLLTPLRSVAYIGYGARRPAAGPVSLYR